MLFLIFIFIWTISILSNSKSVSYHLVNCLNKWYINTVFYRIYIKAEWLIQDWCHKFMIRELKKLKWEDHEFKVTLDITVKSYAPPKTESFGIMSASKHWKTSNSLKIIIIQFYVWFSALTIGLKNIWNLRKLKPQKNQ